MTVPHARCTCARMRACRGKRMYARAGAGVDMGAGVFVDMCAKACRHVGRLESTPCIETVMAY